jgi:hypothetical protein
LQVERREEARQQFNAVGLESDCCGTHRSLLWKTKEISRHKSTGVLAGYDREAELFQQHAFVGMY